MLTRIAAAALLALAAAPAMAQDINFGSDDSEWAQDGECDDRRFTGNGMAVSLSWEYVGRDASDCRALYQAGQIKLWNLADSVAATQCAAIDFGNDSGDYPGDGECDDSRFEGLAVAHFMTPDYQGRDATDCLVQCAFGTIGLRDY